MEMKAPVYRLDRDKLIEVVHYICANCSPEELGNVKLHKILYFSDMLHFLSTGEPLTGVEYQKQQFGPTARHLSWAVDKLVAHGKLKIERRDYFGHMKTDYIVLQQPRPGALSNHAVQILNDVIAFVCSRSAKEISELSHDAAWQAAEIGEVIPYDAALGLLPCAITDADVTAAISEAHRVAPLIEKEDAAAQVF
jgi:uncharacterized phage-associated protein